MRDDFGREINYLRISLTDKCNLRCIYCMPEEGVTKLEHRDILSFDEIVEIVREAAKLGINKLRLTGGEPLIRRGVVDLCRELKAIEGIEEIALTTNGTLLPKLAKPLKEAGVQRINISLDTMDPVKYRKMTRVGELDDALNGIRAAVEAGLGPIKINSVLIGGFNDDEIETMVGLTKQYPIEMRYIELMPIGDTNIFGENAYIPCETVLQRMPELEPIPQDNGVAARYRLPGALGTVGLIRPLSCSFCDRCCRMRLTADGFLKPCLHSKEEIPIRGLHGEALRECLQRAILRKPKEHGELSAHSRSEADRNMNAIGG